MRSLIARLRPSGRELSELNASQFCTEETEVLPGRTVLQVLEATRARGIDDAVALAGTTIDAAALAQTPGRISWRTLVSVFDNLERAGVTMEGFEELGAHIGVSPLLLATGLAAAFVRPEHFLYVGLKWVGPALFPIFTHELSREGTTLRLRLELPASFRGSAAYFAICQGTIASMPVVIGHPKARIQARITPHTASYVIDCSARSRPVRPWSRRVRALLNARLAANTLAGLEEELRAGLAVAVDSQRQFRRIMDALPDGVAITRDGEILYANPALGALLGEASSAIIGRAWSQAFPGEGPELRIGRHVVECSPGQDIVYEDRPARLVTCRDVTARRELEKQQALTDKMTTLATLAAGVAHEINNPLTLVLTHAELAARAPTDCHAHIEAMRDGALRVRDIVKDLRIFFASEEDAAQHVDLADVARSTVALARGQAQGRAVLELQLVGGAGPAVMAGRGRIGQVLLNLILNALEAMPEGRAPEHNRVVVRLEGRARTAVLEVEDNGSGIDPASESQVFEPFFSTKAQRLGSGLGLAVASTIVKSYGGTLTFTTQPGRGTTFRMELPAAVAAPTPVPVPRPAVAGPDSAVTPLRVLVVDDEASLLAVVAEALGARGHQVTTAGSGNDAIAAIDRDPALDVILCDLMMPRGSGADVHAHASSHHPELASRILFMTGGSFRPEVRELLARTENRCMAKPFRIDELTGAIEALGRRK